MNRSKSQLFERFTPVLFLSVAVLAWALIQHAMASQLEDTTQPSAPLMAIPDSIQMSSEAVLAWAAQIQRQGYQVTVTLQSFGTTVWLRHPSDPQWKVMFFPLPSASSPTHD
ncbi:MAG: hypothetical protein F9K46_02440 [Anaerolineae bacterium]|nr:MAG: hypothetical protein F9K46_02440 [Anaerolineae bacterium]